MAENSKIEWCDHTFNPWMGCTKVSAGCKHCYAEGQMDHRWNKVQWGPGGKRILENTRVVNFGAEPMWHVGKKNAGRLLDGREWNDVPVSALGGQL